MEENENMADEKEYEVLRDHGTKPGGEAGPAFRKGDTRELRAEQAKALVDTGVLKAQAHEEAGKAEPAPANKAEAKPANKGATISSEELVKRGPGRPRTNPPAVDDDDEE
jgi:hypothetical protein